MNLSSVLLYSLLYSSKCHEWSAAPISTCLRRGPRGCFRSDCWACGESMSAPRVNRFLYTHPPTQNTRLDRPQVPTGNRTMSPSFGDLSLTNCNIQTVEPAIFYFVFFCYYLDKLPFWIHEIISEQNKGLLQMRETMFLYETKFKKIISLKFHTNVHRIFTSLGIDLARVGSRVGRSGRSPPLNLRK